MSETAEKFTHLPPAAGRLGAVFARPKALAAICCVALAGLGWFALGVIFADMSALETFCRPLAEPVAWNASGLAVVALMWGAMTLAMMLPSAAPMILTYAEIADMAARKGDRIVSPFVIASGYALVWLGFAAAAALAQVTLTRLALIEAASGLFSGAIFLGAGVYQFSALKHACLRQCRHPFPFFFANWATTPRAVFRLGVKQGGTASAVAGR
jgi:predicted metal-binding membrane protein